MSVGRIWAYVIDKIIAKNYNYSGVEKVNSLEKAKKEIYRCATCGAIFQRAEVCPRCKSIKVKEITYLQLAIAAKVGEAATFRAVTDPGRTKLKTILKLAKILNVSYEESENVWRAAKLEKAQKKFGAL